MPVNLWLLTVMFRSLLFLTRKNIDQQPKGLSCLKLQLLPFELLQKRFVSSPRFPCWT